MSENWLIGKYLNYGECQVCHEKKARVMGTAICQDCLYKCIDEFGKESK